MTFILEISQKPSRAGFVHVMSNKMLQLKKFQNLSNNSDRKI